MTAIEAHLSKFLEDQMRDVTDAVMKLVKEDAPKNKFSILTGKHLAFEDVKAEIERFLQQSKAS